MSHMKSNAETKFLRIGEVVVELRLGEHPNSEAVGSGLWSWGEAKVMHIHTYICNANENKEKKLQRYNNTKR